MITSFEELTEEQIEALSDVMIAKFTMRTTSTFRKGNDLFKTLVKSGIGKTSVSELYLGCYMRSNGMYIVYIQSPRIKFIYMLITEEQYDQLLGVI